MSQTTVIRATYACNHTWALKVAATVSPETIDAIRADAAEHDCAECVSREAVRKSNMVRSN